MCYQSICLVNFSDLSSNSLLTLPSGLFSRNGQLEIVDISGNQITHLPDEAFVALKNLTQLDLSGNNLTQINENCNLITIIHLTAVN